MVNQQHYRWDFIGLSTDTKPTPETSEKVVDGSTFYCSDNSKLYVFCKDTWYEKTVSGGGGTSDFDQLSNRPKYNGVTMTSETDIPEVIDVNEYIIQNAGTPTTSTEGTVGQLLEDTTNGKLYICTAVTPGTDPDPDTYTWSEVGAGGGGTAGSQRLLTTDDYNWNSVNSSATGTLNCVGIWLLDPGQYYIELNTSLAWSMIYKGGSRDAYVGTFIVGSVNNGTRTILFLNSTGGASLFYTAYDGTLSKYINLTPATTTGTSDTQAMSQNATTSMVYADPGTKQKVKIGADAISNGAIGVAIGFDSAVQSNASGGVAIGGNAKVTATSAKNNQIAIGQGSQCSGDNAVALGGYANATQQGQFDISTGSQTTSGYNSSNYRLISGVYDGQSNHDAATYGQLNTRLGGFTLLQITQTDYDALTTKDPNTLYIIVGA